MQLHATRLKGFGTKAANILTQLVEGEKSLMNLLQCLLQPHDFAVLVRIVARGTKAGDVEVSSEQSLYPELSRFGALAVSPNASQSVKLVPSHITKENVLAQR